MIEDGLFRDFDVEGGATAAALGELAADDRLNTIVKDAVRAAIERSDLVKPFGTNKLRSFI